MKMGGGFCACPCFCVAGKSSVASPREVLGSGEGGWNSNYHQARAGGTPQLPSIGGGWTPPPPNYHQRSRKRRRPDARTASRLGQDGGDALPGATATSQAPPALPLALPALFSSRQRCYRENSAPSQLGTNVASTLLRETLGSKANHNYARSLTSWSRSALSPPN